MTRTVITKLHEAHEILGHAPPHPQVKRIIDHVPVSRSTVTYPWAGSWVIASNTPSHPNPRALSLSPSLPRPPPPPPLSLAPLLLSISFTRLERGGWGATCRAGWRVVGPSDPMRGCGGTSSLMHRERRRAGCAPGPAGEYNHTWPQPVSNKYLPETR